MASYQGLFLIHTSFLNQEPVLICFFYFPWLTISYFPKTSKKKKKKKNQFCPFFVSNSAKKHKETNQLTDGGGINTVKIEVSAERKVSRGYRLLQYMSCHCVGSHSPKLGDQSKRVLEKFENGYRIQIVETYI